MGRRIIAVVASILLGATALGVPSTPAQAATPITVRGVVRDDLGRPVAGARVEAIHCYGHALCVTYGVTSTAETGRYALTFDPRRVIDGEPMWATSILVTVPSEEWLHEVRTLPAYSPGDSVRVPVTIRTVSGTVTDGSGAPVTGAMVHLHNIADEGDSNTDGCEPSCEASIWHDAHLRTDANGHFARRVDATDLVGVVVEADDHRSWVQYDVLPGARLAVDLAPGEPGVEPVTVTGTMRDALAAPVPHQPVRIPDVTAAETGEDGRFALTFDPTTLELWGEPLQVFPDADGFEVIGPGPSGYFEPGAHHSVDLQVDEMATITGVVTEGQGGPPLPGVSVGIEHGPSMTTGPDGRFALSTVPGPLTLSYRAAGYFPFEGIRSLVADPGQVLDLTLTMVATVPPTMPTGVTAGPKGPRRAWVSAADVDHGGTRADLKQARCRGRDAPVRSGRTDLVALVHPVVVDRLRPAHRYRCRMRFHSPMGWGPWSAFSDPFRTPRRRR